MASAGARFWTDLKAYWRPLVIIVTPILLCPLPAAIGTLEARCAYVVLLMAIYWMTEALPLAITAFLPLILYPPLGVLSAYHVSVEYLKDSNFVFFGSMLMALAVEESQLHRRIALHVLVRVGSSPRRLMFGFMISTGFLSMWMSNTAATAMMVPLAFAVMHELPETADEQPNASAACHENPVEVSAVSLDEKSVSISTNYASTSSECTIKMEGAEDRSPRKLQRAGKGLLLSICYAANIGGTGTLTGTGSNIVLTGQLDSIYHSQATGITFASWMAFAVPQMIVMLILAWIWLQLVFIGFRGCINRQKENSLAKTVLLNKLRELGPMRFAEKITLATSFLLVLLWLFRDPGFIPGWASAFPQGFVSDGTTAMFIGCLFFVVPKDLPQFTACFPRRTSQARAPWRALLTWELMQKKFSWSVVLLLGGGYAMAAGVEHSGLDRWISQGLSSLQTMPTAVFVGISVVLVTFLTEFSSNVAVASVFIPIGASMAELMRINPLYVIIPIATSCSFAFMLPVATPPNSIVFGAGLLRVVDMALAGFFMNLICVFVLLVNINTYGYWLFGCASYPTWANQTSSGLLVPQLV